MNEIEFPAGQFDDREIEKERERKRGESSRRTDQLDYPLIIRASAVTELIPGTLIKQRKARIPSHLESIQDGLLTADYSPAGSFFSFVLPSRDRSYASRLHAPLTKLDRRRTSIYCPRANLRESSSSPPLPLHFPPLTIFPFIRLMGFRTLALLGDGLHF